MTEARSEYSARYIEQYSTGGFETILVAIRREQVLKFLRGCAHRRVVEIGCGLEPLFAFWSEFDAMTIVEPSADFVAAAEKRAAGDRRIVMLNAYLEDVSAEVARSKPDAVVVSSLLHEVPDAGRLLQSVAAICAPETIVHFNVPNVRSFHRLLALEMGVIADLFEQSDMEKRFHRHTRYDREKFETALRNGGFEILESGTYFVKPFTHAQMEAILATGAVDLRVIEGLNKMTKYLPDLGCEMYANVRVRR